MARLGSGLTYASQGGARGCHVVSFEASYNTLNPPTHGNNSSHSRCCLDKRLFAGAFGWRCFRGRNWSQWDASIVGVSTTTHESTADSEVTSGCNDSSHRAINNRHDGNYRMRPLELSLSTACSCGNPKSVVQFVTSGSQSSNAKRTTQVQSEQDASHTIPGFNIIHWHPGPWSIPNAGPRHERPNSVEWLHFVLHTPFAHNAAPVTTSTMARDHLLQSPFSDYISIVCQGQWNGLNVFMQHKAL